MFKSTKDFETSMYNILCDVNKGINIFDIKAKSDKQEFDDALEQCHNCGYILGIKIQGKSVNGNLFFDTEDNVRLSYSGLKFIENFKN